MIWGDEDPYGGPEIGQEAAELIPDAHLEVAPGRGRMIVWKSGTPRPEHYCGHEAEDQFVACTTLLRWRRAFFGLGIVRCARPA